MESVKKKKKRDFSTEIAKYIKVNPIGQDAWQVDIYLPFLEMTDDILPKVLRIAKEKIASQNDFPIGLLTYQDLMQKVIKTDGVNVSAKIIRAEAERGTSEIRILPATSVKGIEYDYMIIYLDLYPLREDGEKMLGKDVWKLLGDDNLTEDMINIELIQESIETLTNEMIPVKNILIAQGRFPELGEDASIEYFIKFTHEDRGVSFGRDKVAPGAELAKKIPADTLTVPGFTVFSETIVPENPMDIKLLAGDGAEPSKDRNSVIASKAGIPKAVVQESTDLGIKAVVHISIEGIEVLDGTKAVNITTDKHIEITGGLKSGSQIISQGEVLVSGDIEEGTSVVTSGNISVTGNISGGSLTSEKSITTEGNVANARLAAHGVLTIQGTAKNSNLSANEVTTNEIVGCNVIVGVKAKIDTISADERGFTAKISAGLMAHLEEKIEENVRFIDFANKNLKRFGQIFCQRILHEATPSNVSRMIIIHATELKKSGIHTIPGEQMTPLKALIRTIGPIRYLKDEKVDANKHFEKQLKLKRTSDAEISTDQVENEVEIEINGISSTISATDGPVTVTEKDGQIVKIPEPKEAV